MNSFLVDLIGHPLGDYGAIITQSDIQILYTKYQISKNLKKKGARFVSCTLVYDIYASALSALAEVAFFLFTTIVTQRETIATTSPEIAMIMVSEP